MFAQLIESRPIRRRSPAGVAASLAVHGILVAGVVVVTSHGVGRRDHGPRDVTVRFLTSKPQPPKVAATEPRRSATAPVGPSVIQVPITVPDVLPPIDLRRAIIDTDQPFVFRIGVRSQASDPVPVPADPGAAFLAEQVEVPAALDMRSPLPRYPQLLRDAGVEGMVRLQFVVDTLGRVEMETVRVIASAHPAFTAAAQGTLPRMHFTPARVGGRAVRQQVEFPLQFRLDR